jgi:hypothetical protein
MTCDECGEGFQPGDEVVATKSETVLETDEEGRIVRSRWDTIIEEFHAECI